MQSRQLKLIHLVILLTLFVFALSTRSYANQKDGLLKIHFFDIGQGDAIFIETPSGYQILIDGGPDNRVLQRLGEVMPFYDKDIDVVVVSHPHADHIAGLISVLDKYEVANVFEAEEDYNSSEFKAWEGAIKEEGANEIEAITGKIIDFGDGVILEFLHPFESFVGAETDKPHDDVVVAILRYNNFELMLTGDMEARIERRLIMAGYNLDSDVLKVGHHGSKTSSSEEFLSAISPEVAIIQVGEKNRYGLPTPEILKRFDDYDIKYYRNDLNGDIKLTSDGINYLISTQK